MIWRDGEAGKKRGGTVVSSAALTQMNPLRGGDDAAGGANVAQRLTGEACSAG